MSHSNGPGLAPAEPKTSYLATSRSTSDLPGARGMGAAGSVTPAAGALSGENEWDDGGSDDELPPLQTLLCHAPQRTWQDTSQVIDLTVDTEGDEVDKVSSLSDSFRSWLILNATGLQAAILPSIPLRTPSACRSPSINVQDPRESATPASLSVTALPRKSPFKNRPPSAVRRPSMLIS
jgi:hypothetical protein